MRILLVDRNGRADNPRQGLSLDTTLAPALAAAQMPVAAVSSPTNYALSTDGDQDQVVVWQLFDPSLVQWLAEEAPEDFSKVLGRLYQAIDRMDRVLRLPDA